MGRPKQATTSTRVGLESDAKAAQKQLRSLGCPEQAALLARFFKTGPGQYGEGDRFIGVKVPVIRTVAKEFKNLATRNSLSSPHSAPEDRPGCHQGEEAAQEGTGDYGRPEAISVVNEHETQDQAGYRI